MKSLLLIAAVALVGCSTVPSTQITVPTKKGPLKIISPKETDWQGVSVKFSADGSFEFSVNSVKAQNQADVVRAVTDANAKMLQAGLDAAGSMAGQAARAAVKP